MRMSALLSLPSLTGLRAFAAAAHFGSFKRAAVVLGVTATAVSHSIRALEDELGSALFTRLPRAVELTAAGQTLHAAVRDGFAAIAAGVDRIRAPARPSVTLSTTPAFAARWLVPRIAALQAAHPDIDLRIHASNDPVELRSGAYDLAIRYGRGPYGDLAMTTLLQDSFVPVASPALHIGSAAELAGHPLIHFDWHRPPPVDLTWSAWARAAGLATAMTHGIRYSEESHAIQAAIAGQGVALLSRVLVQDELRLGSLAICRGPALAALAYHLLRPARASSPAAATVASWLVGEAAAATR